MRIITALAALVATAPLAAAPFNPITRDLPKVSDASTDMQMEVANLDALIAVTDDSLIAQKKIRGELIEYQNLQQKYLNNAADRSLLFMMIKSAYAIRETINAYHLEHLFSKDFLEELNIFAQVAEKRPSPKP